MAVASAPDQNLTWPVATSPIYFGSARVNEGLSSDLVSIDGSGTFAIGENANNNSWRTTLTSQPLGSNVTALAAASGLLSGGTNPDPFEDFVLQTPTHFEVLRTNGNASWSSIQSLPYSGTPNAATYPATQPISALLGSGLISDFIFPLPQSNSIAILTGKPDGTLSPPIIIPSGDNTPILVSAANMLAGPSIDIAVGHADGTVTFLEGQTDGSFILRPDLTLPNVVPAMRSMKTSDVDGDGVFEVTIVGGNQAVQLRSAPDPLPESPIRNGSFDQGLVGWTVNTIGQPANATPGSINALSGAAQFTENQSFLTSLSQSFVVPPDNQSIQFDLVALGLETANNGSLPDAFEVSLLDSSNQSLVPTHSSQSTAFVNFTPDNGYRAASGVTRNGTLITLDIASLTPGTTANLVFDLIGNPHGAISNGTRSTATIDRVRITPEVIRNDSFLVTSLPGPFQDARDLAIADVDGDGRSDIIITDLGLNQIVVLNALPPSTAIPTAWSRDPIGLPAGFAPYRVTAGTFTSGDNIADLAVLSSAGTTVRSPLVADTTVPTVQLQSPSSSITLGTTQSAADVFGTITLQFSEAMFLASSTTPGSINHLAAYRVYHLGANNSDDGGLGDDVLFSVTSVSYDAATNRVQLQLDNSALANAAIAAGSLYKIVVAGADPTIGVRDIAGNRIAGGQDFVATVALNRTPTLSSLSPQSVGEGVEFSLSQQLAHYSLNRVYDAIIDWGDSSLPTTLSGNNAFPTEAFEANHIYANDGSYTLLVRIMEGAVEVARTTANVSVRNAAPTIQSLAPIAGNEGQAIAYAFTASDSGLADTIVAHVDWGDGTSSTLPVASQLGSTRTFTTSHTFPDNGTYTVRVRVADELDESESTVTAAIASVAPGFNVSNATAVVGIPFSLGPIDISDPGFTSVPNGSVETLSATVNWGDGSPTESVPLTDFIQGSAGRPTTASLTASRTFSSAGSYTVTVTVADDDGATTVRTLTVIVSPVSTPDAWLPILNFDRDGFGNVIPKGAIVAEQWANWGVHIGSTNSNHPPMIFSSTNPTGDDFDLGSPNAAFGGPGIGSAGASGPTENRFDLKNVLILSEDGDGSDPDDNAPGGTLMFDFDHNVMIDDVKLLDIDAHETATLKWFDRTGNLIGQSVVTGVGTGNGLHIAAINARGVARLTVALSGSGAITEIVFCRDVLPASAIQIVGNPSTQEAASYTLALQANGNVVDQWIVNWGNGTYTTYPGNATTASFTYSDGPASAVIMAYGLSSSSHHVYASTELLLAIENVVPTLTVSGSAIVDASQTYTLNLSESDPGTDTIKGWLVDWGDGSPYQPLVGNPASVTHQYNQHGTFNIVAHAFDEDYTGPFHPAFGSLIEIHARGDEGGETFNLLIDDVVVQSYTATTAQQKFTFHTSTAVAPNQVKVQFTNDLWEPANNIDRNLIVDRVVINNRIFETEAADVYSTGTWKQADGVQPGFRKSEWLTNNGFFHFDQDANDGTSVTVRARGDMGGEQFTLSIAGTVVGTYTVGTSYQDFTYRSSRIVAPEQVRVSFINDLWEPANNIDRNLHVDYMELSDGLNAQRYQTEDASVYATGLWTQGEGIVSGYRQMDWLAANGYFQYAATDENGPFATEWISNSLTITVTGDDSQCLPNIDFDRAANGQSLSRGTRITNQFATLGLTISTLNPNHPAMIFNSAAPTGGDTDLGTPNQVYGGPGIGSGGASNNKPLKNVLIISEDNSSSNPDDNAAGGTFVFTYANLTKIEEIHLLDIDEHGTHIKLFGANNTLIKTVNVPKAGDNSFQVVRLDATRVLRMEVVFAGSGAIAAVISCVGGPTIGPPNTKFFVADTNDRIYRYAQNNSGVGNFTVQTSVNARGIATNRDSNPLWVISEEGTNDKVYVYDSSTELLLGSWTPTGINRPQGITTDGTHLWVVDSSTKRVSFFSNGAARRSGSAAESTSFALHSHNSSPTDLVTDGTHIFVVDDGCDNVFVYNLAGGLVNRWALPSANADPSGITINTRESNGIYVLDRVDRRVYRYTNRIMPTNNVTQAVASSFALSSGNNNPQGIADPGGFTQIGSVVNDGFESPNTTIDWTFDATAGQTIYVNFQSMTNQRMTSQLIDPLGNILYTRSGYWSFRASEHDSGPRPLATTGTYTLRLTSEETPSFQFKIWEIPAPDVENVVLGQTMSGAIEVPGAEDHWNFTAAANQRMYFDMTSLTNTASLANTRVEIYAPNGAVVFGRNAFRVNSLDGSFTSTVAGDYRIVVKADAGNSNSPTYSFSLTNIPDDDIQTIGYRQLATGAIESPGARDQWKFHGTAGDNIFIDYLTITGGDLQTTLVSPSGVTIHNTAFSREYGLDVELVLPETGIYTFHQYAAYDAASLFDYSFQIWDIPPEVPQPALLNTTISGSLVPGQETTYLFQVDQPTDVLFDSIDINSTSVFNRIAFTLRHPDGSIILARNFQDQMLTLTTPGTYQVVVQKWDINDADTQGTYAFRIQDRATPAMGALDNLGTKFYVGFPRNLREVFNFQVPSFSLTITGPRATSGTVQVPGTNFFTSYDVIPGQSTRIELPSQVELYNSDVVTNLGVLVTALDEVAVYGLNQLTFSTDGFTALPVDALGRDYVSLGYSNTISYVLGGGTYVALVAAMDNTEVTITPKITVGSRAAGVPYTINLNQGQTYNLHASTPFGADLSGTFVTATQPIAVFGGNTAARVPEGFTFADHLIEQMPPTNTWGTELLSAPLASRLNGDTFRVLAQADDTQVNINGVLVTTLARGAFYETVLTTASHITADKPILVAQYANGTQFDGVLADPFMMLIPPRQQFQRDYTLSTPATGFLASFANIVLPTSAIATIRHNGNEIPLVEFNSIAGTDHSFVRIPISVGTHNFNADVPFGVSIYGFNDHDSYGYFGGMQFAPLQEISTLNLTPASITVPLNSQHTVAAQIVDGAGVGIAGVRVSFSVQGVSGSQAFERITNASGLATLTITSPNTGLDTVTAFAAGLTQVATVQWQAANPTLTIDSPASGGSLVVGTHVLSGRARAGVPSGSIVEVLVNGRRADALDPSGQFFAAIDVSSGLQAFTITAIDQLGQSVSEVLQLTGLVDAIDPNDLSSFSDVTSSAAVQFTGTTYHRANRQLSADLQVVNTSDFRLDGPIFVRFDRFTSSSISVANADADPDIRRVTDSSIASLATSGKADLRIANPNEDRFSAEVTVLARGNRPPRFVSIPSTQIGAGSQYRYTAAAIDPDTGLYHQSPISFRLLTAPEGMTIDATTGQVSWTTAATDVGSHQLSIEAADGRGGAAVQSFSLAVLATLPNRPPVFSSSPNLGAAPGSLYSYQATARDLDGDTLSFALTSGPAGATMTTDGLLEWSAPVTGAHPIVITVSDAGGGSATQQYTLYVGGGLSTLVPTIVSQPPVLAYPNSLYQYSVEATNPFATALTYSLLDAPIGMTINASTGVIQWTPTAAQLGSTPIVRIEVRNNEGGLASQSYAVSVIAQTPVVPPRFVSSPVAFATVDSLYGYDADAVLISGPSGKNTPDTGLSYAILAGPTGLTINGSTGLVAWTPASGDLGNHRVLISATDTQTGLLKAYQQYYLSVRSVNTPPTFTSTPIESIDAGTYYRYDARATDTEDAVRYSLVTLPSTSAPAMQIDPIGGAITWQPLLNVGSYPITIRATDERGAFTDQSFTLTVNPDTRAPSVSIVLSKSTIDQNETIQLQVSAVDNYNLTNSVYSTLMPAASLELRVDGVLVPLDATGRATYTGTAVGFDRFVATATDSSGNIGTDSALLRVLDPSDTTPPVVDIAAPLTRSTITYLTDVIGSVSDANLESWTLEYSRVNTDQWKPIASKTILDGPVEVNNALLGVFDPTLLRNDQYTIRLTAIDLGGLTAQDSIIVALDGNAKIGALNIPLAEDCENCMAADVMIAVAGGPPISITRQYSTLEADSSGDFGHGWQYCMAQPNLIETPARSPFEILVGQFAATPFRDGDKVYLTTPTCERVGFTFSPIQHVGVWSVVGQSFFEPRWIPDPGVEWNLYGENDFTRLTGIASGEFDLNGLPLPLLRYADNQYILAAISTSYNPLGYQLIHKDGTRYHYDQYEGLTDVTDRNGNRLDFSDSGIVSSSGQSVQFQRDDQGRITKIRDQDGRETNYFYNAAGDLERVEYPNGLSNTYKYTADHLLAAINEDNPQQAMLETVFEYDLAGRLAATISAFGHTNTQTYDLATRTQTNYDGLGNPTLMHYDLRGNMISETSPNGDTANYEYDANDNLTKVIDEAGAISTITYDDRRNLTSFTDAVGNVTLFQYNLGNDVISQRDGRGGEYYFDYDGLRNLARIRAPGGADSTMQYDAQGRLLQSTAVDGRTRRYEYGNLNVPIRIVDRDGSAIAIEYNSDGNMTKYTDELGRVMTVTYDANQRPLRITNAKGNDTIYAYSGNVISSITDPLGNVTSMIYDGDRRPIRINQPDGGVIRYEYDAANRRTAIVDPNGNRTQFVYRNDGRLMQSINQQGGVLAYTYDATGRQTSITNENGNEWQVEFDAIGLVTKEIDPLGNFTQMVRDGMGNLISFTDELGRTTTTEYNSIQRPTRITNALGDSIEMTYSWDGRLLTEKDTLGRIHSYEYDSRNRLVSLTDPLSGTMTYEYDAVGNRTKIRDERGNETLVAFDALNRPLQITDPSGAVTQYTFDDEARPTQTIDPSGATRNFTYDPVGRMLTTTDVLGGVSEWTYDLAGNILTAKDPINRTTQFAYDTLNRRITATDPLGAITRFTYDAASNIATIRDSANNLTQFEYDDLERMTRRIDPLGNASTMAYDAVSNLTQTTDRNGRIRQFNYDALNRRTSELWTNGITTVNTLNYDYDDVGNITAAGDAFSQYTFVYDALNRMTSVDNLGTPSTPRLILTSTYDAADNRTSISDQNGITVSSTFDNRNFLATRTWSGGGVSNARADFTYDPRGLLSSISRYSSLNTSSLVGLSEMSYDAKGRLEQLLHKGSTNETLVTYNYTRDLADQLTQETHHGQTRIYTRDNLGQVTSASLNGIPVEQYSYDLHGNRTSAASVTGPDNRLTENASHTFDYDNEGNLIRKTDKATGQIENYTFDHRNRLTSYSKTTSVGVVLTTIDYTYDVFDRRIARSVDSDGAGPLVSVRVTTLYDGEHAWADYDQAGTVQTRYLYGDRTDQILARWNAAGGTAWYLTDHLGTVRDLANASGTIVNTIDYDSFGRILNQTNAALGDRFTYTGREWDAELGLFYYRARFYDPVTGRFVSQDPLGFTAGDTNLYRYVGNNPLDFVDPSGNLAVTECAIVRYASLVVDLACPVLQSYLQGGTEAVGEMAIDQVVERTMMLVNRAIGTLPFGAGMALQLTMKALTIKTVAQSLANLDVNEHLFTIMGMAETYVREAYRIAGQDSSTTFQQVMSAYSGIENKPLFWSQMVCGSAELGLMVASAFSRCFVAGTPVVVALRSNDEESEQAYLAGDSLGLTIVDVIGVIAVGGLVYARYRRAKDEQEERKEKMLTTRDQALFELDEDQADPLTGDALICGCSSYISPSASVSGFSCSTNITSAPLAPLAPYSGRGAGGEGLEKCEVGSEKSESTTPTKASQPTRRAYMGRPAKLKSRSSWLSILTTFGLLAVAVCCIAPRALNLFGNKPAIASHTTKAAASKSTLVTKPIEEIRCGDRIPSQLPSGVDASNDEIPNQATWRLVELEIEKKDGEKLQASLLRPLAWLEQAGAIREGTFAISIEELEVEGEAAVVRVLPCPPIQSGAGQVVTGTFKHSCDEFVTLTIADQSDTITCTTGHPIWSEQRQDFIDAADLKQGESVRLANNRLSPVTHIHRFHQPQSVYNLEINTTHVYFVGQSGLLVHNADANCDGASWKSRRSFQDGDTGLKNHANRHSTLSPAEYLLRGQRTVRNGKSLKGGGRDPSVKYHVMKVGEDQYTTAITDNRGRLLSIDTWSADGVLSRADLTKALAKSGVTPPKDFWDSLE